MPRLVYSTAIENNPFRRQVQVRHQYILLGLVSLVGLYFLSHFCFSRSFPLTRLLLPPDGHHLRGFIFDMYLYISHRLLAGNCVSRRSHLFPVTAEGTRLLYSPRPIST